MRMFSDQPGLEMIEVLTHLDSTVGPTIQLSAKPDLDEARQECEALRDRMREGFDRWIRDIDEREGRGKRVLNSSSVAFQVSPVVHNAELHDHSATNGLIGNGGTGKILNGYASRRTDSLPSSSAFWSLPSPSSDKAETTSPPNPTPFPVPFPRSHIPIFLIRHPALAFPSTIRVASEYFNTAVGDVFMNIILRYRWHRILYDWYAADAHQQNGEPKKDEPIILDADDLMYNPSAVSELCRRTGLDFAKVKYEWAEEAKTSMKLTYANENVFTNTLVESTGVVKGKGSDGVDVEVEAEKWVKEFGVERAALLRLRVEEAMGDYLYLRERSLGRLIEV